MRRTARFWPIVPFAALVGVLVYYGYAATLPRLDPTGHGSSDEAIAAMIRGEPVYDLGSRRILFRRDYEMKAD